MSKYRKTKEVYLVRHGESEHNIKPIFQGYHVDLSENGLKQADTVASRVAKLDFEALIASPQPRAQQTAKAISSLTGKQIETSGLFVERLKPTSVNDKPFTDKQAAATWRKWEDTMNGKVKERVEDGETQAEIIERADQALDYLLQRDEERLVAVTHGYFMRVLIARVLLGEQLNSANLNQFLSATAVENTGITVIQYTEEFEQPLAWRLWTFNDHAHLAE